MIDVLKIVSAYQILRSSHVEGIEFFANKFSTLVKNLSGKTYDTLDHRRDYFDKDYDDFKKAIADVERDFREFADKRIKSAQETLESIKWVER